MSATLIFSLMRTSRCNCCGESVQDPCYSVKDASKCILNKKRNENLFENTNGREVHKSDRRLEEASQSDSGNQQFRGSRFTREQEETS